MITRPVRIALDQLEKYDIPRVSFIKKKFFIFDEDNGKIISQFDKKPTEDYSIEISTETDLNAVFATKVNTSNLNASSGFGGILHITVNGHAFFVPNTSGEIEVTFNSFDDAIKPNSYVLDNDYDLDQLVEDHRLEEKDHVIFKVTDGEKWNQEESDGLYHLRNKESRRVELWYKGIEEQI